MRTFLLSMLIMCLFVGCGESKTSQPTGRLEQAEEPAVVRIGIIDSGISTYAIPAEYIAEGKNYVDPEAGTEDTYGHGTAVASIIYLEAENRNFIFVPLVDAMYDKGSIRAVDAAGLAEIIMEAIDTYHCDILQISGGMPEDNSELKAAIEYAAQKQVVIVSAVGNDFETNPGQLYYPAAYPSVIAVGATDADGNRAEFSQDWADVYEPGVDVPILLMSGKSSSGSATSYAAARHTAVLLNVAKGPSPRQ